MNRFARTIHPLAFLGLVFAIPFSGICASTESTRAKSDKSASSTSEGRDSSVENSVVKVFATVRYPDLYKPWTKLSPTDITGSGVVIEGKRILTSAHVVAYASQVQIQANQAGDKVAATVEATGPGIDLAVLKVDDETFFDSHPPLARAKTLPAITDSVMAYGYPKGGASLSITKGIVSRIEFASYNYPVAGLRIQIDAAINPGNSGGPAVANGKMIGLAFAHLGASENIGYIVPCEEIDLFLQDIADGHYDGKPAFFDECQTLENGTLRSFLKLDKSVQGMVVHKPDSKELGYPLKEWDVITKIGDTKVDDQGMIKIDGGLRVAFIYLVQKIAKNGNVPLTIVRAGKEMTVDVPVLNYRPTVLPNLQGGYPSYFVYGPMVFSTATTDFVGGFMRGYSGGSAMGVLSALGSPLIKRVGDKPAFEGESLVIVSSPFFPHKLAKGYSNPASQVIKTINGIQIKNLKHLVEVLRDSKDEFITIEYDSRRGETMVFPRAEMAAATDEILSDNGLRSQASADILPIWNAKSR
jgi:S1-C subfamily serine protease